jgi:hypothetical protein
MKQKSKSAQRHNALRHGAFAKELVILAENQEDFDELHNSCIKELKPSGRMEGEVVLAIAKYMWRKRRIERLFVDEANWLQEHPDSEELRWVAWIRGMIRKESPCQFVWQLIAFLPENYREAIQKEFSCPSTEFDDEWIERVKERIFDLRVLAIDALIEKRMSIDFVGKTAAKIRELSAKQTNLEERLDLMIDKALKRLANLKAFKEVMAVQVADRPRKISTS